MENNSTPRKARIYYMSESIPVIVLSEDNWEYKLLLDIDRVKGTTIDIPSILHKRAIYIDALMGYAGAHKNSPNFVATVGALYLHKGNPDVTLVFDDPEHKEEGEPAEMNEPDNVEPFPKVAKLTELDRQLNLMTHLNYEVKSWDISFPEDGEPQLYATFTKVEEVHPF